MQFLKEIFNSMARTIGRILVYAFLGFILYLLANKYVNAESYYVTIENNNGNVVSQSLTTNDFPFSHTSSAYGTTCTSPTNCQELPHEQLRFTLLQDLSKTYMYDFQGQIIVTYRILGNYVGFPTNDIQCYFRGTTETIPCGARISTDLTSDFNDYGLKFTVTIDYNITNASPSINRSGIQIFIPKPDLGWTGNNYLVVEKFDISLPTYRQNTKDNTDVLTGNANANAQNIISSQESIGGNIIQNQNENTEEIVDTINNLNKVCENYNFNYSNLSSDTIFGRFDSNGVISESGNFKITNFIQISDNSYTISKNYNVSNPLYVCTYDYYKTLINCYNFNNLESYTLNNENATFIRINFRANTNDITNLSGQYCYNILEKNGQNIDDIKNSLLDDSVPSNGWINDIALSSDTPITNLITLPIQFMNSFLYGFEGQCVTYDLGELYGTHLTLPCMNLESRLGSNLWHTIDILGSMFMGYEIIMLMISCFESVTMLNDGFLQLYTPKHEYSGYKPRHGSK